MTPGDRAYEILPKFVLIANWPSDAAALIEQAIIAAVEEERQITLSAIQSQSEWALQNRDKSVSDSADWHFWFGEVKACELIEAQIRSRSNPNRS
jgi:hypothetical protein